MYVAAKNRYEEFVNAFATLNSSVSRADLKRQADAAWRATGKGEDRSEVEKVISAASSLTASDEKISGKSFIVPSASCDKQSSATCPLPTVNMTAPKSPRSDQLSSAGSRSKPIMEEFLKNHVSMDSSDVANLLSADVTANVIVVETLLDAATNVSNAKLLMLDYEDLKQRSWGQSKLKQLGLQLDKELADVKT